jgi:hypothetical protein
MYHQISIIIFTYKRAILLEEVLKSIFVNFKNKKFPIHVIYHYNAEHALSYKILINKWKKKGVLFYERKEVGIGKLLFLCIRRPLNFLWLLRWPDILKKYNNFKSLLENIISKIDTDCLTFVTDDQIFYNETIIPDQAIKFLSDRKKDYFYRYFTGDHFKGYNYLYKNLEVKYYKYNNKKFFFSWCSKGKVKEVSPLWKYRFTVEGTVYNKHAILELLKPMIYHNPITLEAIALWESRFRNFFRFGLSSKNRTAAGYQINSVQNYVIHPNNNFDPNLLMKAFLKGYKIYINKKDFKNYNFNVVPKNIFLYKRANKLIPYKNIKKCFSKKN